jgi:transposase
MTVPKRPASLRDARVSGRSRTRALSCRNAIAPAPPTNANPTSAYARSRRPNTLEGHAETGVADDVSIDSACPARRSRISAFVHLQRKIAAHRPAIDAALDTGLSQGLVESTNTKIRLLTRIAFGFHGYEPLVALAMLALGSHPPHLPGRN